jgi:sugar phosphate isomerase/epimerase
MQPALSTHIFKPHRLDTGLLDALREGGARTIEIFAARYHFDYTDRSAVREIAQWFRDTGTRATLHQPLTFETTWSRHASPDLNLIATEKMNRIAAMDEVKRALESAELIPLASCVLHLGMANDASTDATFEHSLTAIEHLKAFAGPLGVRLLLENLRNEITSPERLLAVLNIGHFDNVGICLDLGHAHIGEAGIAGSFETLKPRIGEVHIHDNHGFRDEHLWPGSGQIDWTTIYPMLATLPDYVPGVLEIAYELNETAESATRLAAEAFAERRRVLEEAVAQSS